MTIAELVGTTEELTAVDVALAVEVAEELMRTLVAFTEAVALATLLVALAAVAVAFKADATAASAL